MRTKNYDIIILGAGPAGLASLSAIQEPFSLDTLTEEQIQRAVRGFSKGTKTKRVAVVDPHDSWMYTWKKNFAALEIAFLRSPALAHPDLFDSHALLAFANMQGRTDELLESGCGDISSLLPLGQSQVGLWKLPSTKLFLDFCDHMIERLKHDYVCDSAVDVTHNDEEDGFTVILQSGERLFASAVILAMGSVGVPITPSKLKFLPAHCVLPWAAMDELAEQESSESILVVGGGLTAVQAALRCVSLGHEVTLCSRRPLVQRHFDLPLDWFDRRTSARCMSDFYHQSREKRLSLLRESRDGGSIPCLYMNQVLQLVEQGKLRLVVGQAEYKGTTETDEVCIQFHDEDNQTGAFRKVVLACGLQPECTANPLCQKLLKRWPLEVVGGFPCVCEDLQWTHNLFVVGGLGSLNIGPDAANLMGMRRAAQIVSSALECRCWLRSSNVLKNPFSALDLEDTDSESEDSSEEA